VWFNRRQRKRQQSDDVPQAERRWAWQLQLNPQAEVAFTGGLGAFAAEGNPVRVHGEHGVFALSGPPRVISLYVLAARFAAMSHRALKDPEGSVAALVRSCVEAEQPGVLHLREGWLNGEVHGLGRAEVLAAMREATGHMGAWYGDADLGFVCVVAPGDDENTLLVDLSAVVDRYGAVSAHTPLADVLQALMDSEHPGVTWVRPPVGEQRTLVLKGR
jgi:hypothetical protein